MAAIAISGIGCSTASVSSAGQDRVPNQTPVASQVIAAHIGDGVCANGLQTYGKTLHQPAPDITTHLTKGAAIQIAVADLDRMPATATSDAYLAIVDDTTAGHAASLGGPFTGRTMWMVEFGNFAVAGPGTPMRVQPDASPRPDMVLHHALVAVDDLTGTIAWVQTCP